MTLHVFKSQLKGIVQTIPSKSMTHRAMICAALANGESIIKNPLFANDTLQTLDILKKLGMSILTHLDHIKIEGGTIKHANEPLLARESGSTLRFLIPVALITEEEEQFVLSESLARRPLELYKRIFLERGIYFEKMGTDVFVKGPLLPGEYMLSGDVSSQFISGLLFVLPLLKEDSEIIITGPFESRSYVLLTLSVMKAFGVNVKLEKNTLFIPGNQTYKNTTYHVESDYSQAAFFLVSSALGSELTLYGLSQDSLQGDKKILEYLQKFGTTVEQTSTTTTIKPGKHKKVSIDISDTPDLGPILFVLGALSKEEFKIKGIKRLRYKESDRIESMCENLDKVGAKYTLSHDAITFHPATLVGGVEVDSFNDHRICMAMAILATHLEEGLTITGTHSVNKSYPNFFDDLKNIGGKYGRLKEQY